MKRKHRHNLIFFGVCAVLGLTAPQWSCSGGEKEDTAAQQDTTVNAPVDTVSYHDLYEAGMMDGQRAYEMDSGSDERVNAILEIRAAEQRLRAEGMHNSADAYIAGAKRTLFDRL